MSTPDEQKVMGVDTPGSCQFAEVVVPEGQPGRDPDGMPPGIRLGGKGITRPSVSVKPFASSVILLPLTSVTVCSPPG